MPVIISHQKTECNGQSRNRKIAYLAGTPGQNPQRKQGKFKKIQNFHIVLSFHASIMLEGRETDSIFHTKENENDKNDFCGFGIVAPADVLSRMCES